MQTSTQKTKSIKIAARKTAKAANTAARRGAPKLKLIPGKSLQQIHLETLRELREMGIFA